MVDFNSAHGDDGSADQGKDSGVVGTEFRRHKYVRGKYRAGQVASAASDDAERKEDDDENADENENDDSKNSDKKNGASERESIEDQLIAFSRVFSGTLDVSDSSTQILHVFGPKYDPTDATTWGKHHVVVPARTLTAYMLMGRSMVQLDSVPAGNVCGIRGLGRVVPKTATISTMPHMVPLQPMTYESAPIVRVAIEPKRVADMDKLSAGLQLLYQADPNVEIFVQETGEHVIVTCGEVHLERCLRDLNDRFAPDVPVYVSQPIVGFRETLTHTSEDEKVERDSDAAKLHLETPGYWAKALEEELSQDKHDDHQDDDNQDDDGDTKSDSTEQKKKKGFSQIVFTPNKQCAIQVRAVPLPQAVTKVLHKYESQLKLLAQQSSTLKTADRDGASSGWSHKFPFLDTLIAELRDALEAEKTAPIAAFLTPDTLHRVWSLGPRRYGANMLLNCVPYLAHSSALGLAVPSPQTQSSDVSAQELELASKSHIVNSIVSGFQLATAAGPLCEEPMMGVCFVLENIRQRVVAGMSGQMMSATKTACLQAFQARSTRLMEALYLVELQCNDKVLGRLYDVLSKRRATILGEELLNEGTLTYMIRALLPVVESFGFAKAVRKRTSGVASPQLVFSHWQMMEQDPAWQPTTEEELEEFGHVSEKDIFPNLVRDLINGVRRRKGLAVEEKIVQHAEKQRTLARKK
eukprot:TRINITY_DN46771_c0_g1_i1.p1 TRINITY_DN46771_c0_g1~~TRINITY_DN46771_c0_g1_i1.p1  ORF type:complete len:747 (-),score=390.54 TRINITY_DN46771_c0_g1_i1:35-2116(-)